jgi:hypothetical protein
MRRAHTCRKECYFELAHYIGRLGAHRQAVQVVIAAWMRVPSIRRIGDIRLEPPGPPRTVELPKESLIPYSILKEICREQKLVPHEARRYLHSFTDLDFFMEEKDGLRARMQKKNSFETLVHAELLLVDRFSRDNIKFVEQDKYIGCSKGACYFCYHWIDLHHKGFVTPASHNKVFLGCRGPNENLNDNGARLYANMLGKMKSAVEQDILRQIDSRSTIRFQHASTNGSSVAPSCIADT